MKRKNKDRRRKCSTRGAFGQAKIPRSLPSPHEERVWVQTEESDELWIDGLPVWTFSKGFFDSPDGENGSSSG